MKRNAILGLNDQLCFSLYTASRLIMQAYTPDLKEVDLTYPQYLVMLCLFEKDGVTVGNLTERLSLDTGTLSPLLKKLETKKLISRARDSEDERVVTIKLTEKGRNLFTTKAPDIQHSIGCKTKLNEGDFRTLQTHLKKLIKNLEDR